MIIHTLVALTTKGVPDIVKVPTPTPGPGELLVGSDTSLTVYDV